MQDRKDIRIKGELYAEIQALKNNYATISGYIAGKEYDSLEVVGTLQVFRDTLNRISAHILTLYQIKGQKTKITWELLLANLDNALTTMRTSSHPNPRAAIELALNMSEPNAQEVMTYMSQLKESLR